MFDSKGVDDPFFIEKDDGLYRKAGSSYAKCCSAIIRDGDVNRQCKNPALKGKQYCSHHGSTHLKKSEKPQYLQHIFQKERNRFRRVGTELLAKVDNYRDDPDLFSLRDDTAYVTALVDVRAEAAAEGVVERLRGGEVASAHGSSGRSRPGLWVGRPWSSGNGVPWLLPRRRPSAVRGPARRGAALVRPPR